MSAEPDPFRPPFFGEPWPSVLCDDGVRVATPVGVPCLHCDEPIEAGDRGAFSHGAIPDAAYAHVDGYGPMLPEHLECRLRQVVGSVGHQLGQCSCHGGTLEDPPGMTRRQAARAAAELFARRHTANAQNN